MNWLQDITWTSGSTLYTYMSPGLNEFNIVIDSSTINDHRDVAQGYLLATYIDYITVMMDFSY